MAVGRNVTFTLNPPINITAGSWLFDGNILVFWYPGQFIVSDNYKGRLSFNSSTSQITLHSVQVSDSGPYVLQGMNPAVKVELRLSVQGEFCIQLQTNFTSSYDICYLVTVKIKGGQDYKENKEQRAVYSVQEYTP